MDSAFDYDSEDYRFKSCMGLAFKKIVYSSDNFIKKFNYLFNKKKNLVFINYG